ncbi:MAG: hypothetical protein GX682_01050 [Clostridiaceae bacterium]|nr:hypothetical protein [Clostridiaceae bacterium]
MLKNLFKKVIYAFITIFAYLILGKLLEEKSNYKVKAIILAFISSITLASLTNVIYIRMYALVTLNILITTYLHIKLYEKHDRKTLILIGIVATIGSLTHYYYLFYLAALYFRTILQFLADRKNERIKSYTITLVIAAIISITIFPFSIQHIFFGYRGGGGAISGLADVIKWPSFILKVHEYLIEVNFYAFNNILLLFIIAIIGILIYRKIKNINTKIEISKYFKFVYIPTIFYLILDAIVSPWVELRYMLPICALIFIVMCYLLNQLFETIISKKNTLKVMIIFVSMIIILPFILKIETQVTYSDKKDIMYKLENELNIPTVYWFNSKHNRFLDDILLFSKINESYIARDIECTDGNIKKIFEGKDTSEGIIVFINEEQDNIRILNELSKAMKLEKIEHLKRMNACDIYYIK